MGKSTINGHVQSLFVCLPEGKLFQKTMDWVLTGIPFGGSTNGLSFAIRKL